GRLEDKDKAKGIRPRGHRQDRPLDSRDGGADGGLRIRPHSATDQAQPLHGDPGSLQAQRLPRALQAAHAQASHRHPAAHAAHGRFAAAAGPALGREHRDKGDV
ncbi:MAG: SSU ribosomal protein S10p (S20e), partial [uncultured Rubrobacteraceae bacterium]